MEFRILGPLAVLDGDQRLLPLPAGRARALLALLVMHPGEVVSADRLIDELWGEHPPKTAATMMHGFVSRLRKTLEPGRRGDTAPQVLQTVPPGYRLAVPAGDVDANRFERLLDRARGAEPPARSQLLVEALGLWRGPALADFTYEPFAQRAIETLEDLRLVALEERIDADLALGRHGDLVGELQALVAAQPLRERPRGQLMLALYRAGRQADALACYQQARGTLVEELGIEPGRALRDLQQAILRQDPSLDGPPPPGPPARPPADTAGAANWLPRERRTVTVLYSDLAATGDQLADPEALARAEARALETATGVLRRHGARVEELLGGLLVGFFGVPAAHEDDALRAVRAAVELRDAVTALGRDDPPDPPVRLTARTGVETGEIVLAVGASLHSGASGPVLASARRLQQAAGDGEVLVGEATRRLVTGAAVVRRAEVAAGTGRAPAAWWVLEVLPDAEVLDRALDAPMVGRGAELTRLRAALSSAVRRRAAQRLTVVGDPGIGKSKLAREFALAVAAQATVATGRCPAYGDGITFLPLREALLTAAGPGGWATVQALLAREADGGQLADVLAGAIGLSPRPTRPDALFPAMRRALELLAGDRPLVVVFEDLHWAQPTLLDLIDHLTERASATLLLLCLTRPELLERRPGWGGPGARADTLLLGPLPEDEIRQLIEQRARPALPRPAQERIATTARGNPLFAEQLLVTFDDGDLEAIPASLQGLLAMRLDRLGPGERDLLRCASVIGADFSAEAVLALLPDQARPFVGRHLDTLHRLRFVERRTETTFRFSHALIHRAAYQSAARGDRARLHERYADWLAVEASDPPAELDETIGHHLEQAVQQRRAAGQADEATEVLARRAGERLAAGGQRAFARFDVAAAENLLGRARALLPADHPARDGVTELLAQAYQVLGRHRRADGLLAELLAAVDPARDAARQRSLRLERARIQLFSSVDPLPLPEIRGEAEAAARAFADAGEHAEAARAWFVAGYAHLRDGRATAMAEAMGRSLEHAQRSGRTREQLGARWLLVHALLLGPTPVPDCIARCRELLVLHGDEHPGVLSDLALATAMAGALDEARELNERARTICLERVRARRPLLFITHAGGVIELLAGRPTAAVGQLRAARDLAGDMEEWGEATQVAARLSSVLHALGRVQDAARWASRSASHAPPDDVAAAALSRAARARAMAVRGDAPRARALGRDAVALVPAELVNLRADLMVELAEVLWLSDRPDEARHVLADAAALYDRKGNVTSMRRVQERVVG
jgi:DNA-binding SARP family transcriptional activator/class 3 adenylate cyclase